MSVGTGASAIQYVPAIAPDVEQLYVVQRTPPWVMPHSARPMTRVRAAPVPAFPAAQRAVRGGIYAGARAAGARLRQAAEGDGAARDGRQASTASARWRDPELIAQTTPNYTVGCKRILPSNDWYPALARDNVELVTDGVAEVRERSVVTAGGRELEVDALRVRDRLPRHRHARRADGPRPRRPHAGRRLGRLAARAPGRTVPGFPNLFICSAPTPGSGTARWST